MPGQRQTNSGHTVSAETARAYWRANVALLLKLLVVWFLVSFGAGILFVDFLNQFQFFGFKLGFWFAQQGSMLVFVVLIFVYVARMGTLERRFGIDDAGTPDSYDLLESDEDVDDARAKENGRAKSANTDGAA